MSIFLPGVIGLRKTFWAIIVGPVFVRPCLLRVRENIILSELGLAN